jgi:hypothetical protein
MTTTKIPRQGRHTWARDRPTLGAVVLFLLIALAFGVTAIAQGFSSAHTNQKVARDEECLAQVQHANLNRNAALSDLNDRDRDAVNEWIHRVSLDVQDRNVGDIPRAYNAYRLAVQANDRARASYGALVSGTALPENCRPPTVHSAPSTLPTIASPKPTTHVVVLPPLGTSTETSFATVTVTVAGPTLTVFLHGPTSTETFTVSRRVKLTRTVTRTITRTVTTRPRPLSTHP